MKAMLFIVVLAIIFPQFMLLCTLGRSVAGTVRGLFKTQQPNG